jgi:hypothetical protein
MTNRWGKYIQSAIVRAGIAATISMLWRIPVRNFPDNSCRMELAAEPQELVAGRNVKLLLAIIDKASKLVSDLEIVHEKPIHLIVVSDDLSFFNHIHPQPAPDGRYTGETSFPSGGAYKLYASYTLEGAEAQVSELKVDVAGIKSGERAIFSTSNSSVALPSRYGSMSRLDYTRKSVYRERCDETAWLDGRCQSAAIKGLLKQ